MNKAPRYLELANQLRLAIESGNYKIGDLLPTEHDLCKTYTISRHTARAALQRLEDDGLILRKRGAGTRVISSGAPPTFVQPLGGLNELMQYARDARFEVASSEVLSEPNEDLLRVKISRGQWIALYGSRRAEEKTVAATSIYVRDSFGDTPSDYHGLSHAITESLRERHGITIGSITQSICADLITEEDAILLDAKPGTACLKTIRRYFDESDRLIVISISRHPADWFSYEMTYRRPTIK